MSSNSCPRSCLRFWTCEKGSALPPRVRWPISHARAESGAYSRASLLPPTSRDDAAAISLPLPFVQTVWRVGLAEIAVNAISCAFKYLGHTSRVPLVLTVPRGPLPSLHLLKARSHHDRKAAGERHKTNVKRLILYTPLTYGSYKCEEISESGLPHYKQEV